MTYTGVFVDDQDEVYAETLTTPGRLTLTFVPVGPVAQLARQLFASRPSLIALDYRLDETPEGLAADQTYKGSALGQHLRDAAIENPQHDFAIVLVSAEAKIQALYRPDKTAHDLFDRVYVKERVNLERAQVRRELVSLCEGYDLLRGCAGVYNFAELASLPEGGSERVSSQELRVKLAEASAPHIVARAFLNWLIDRSGLLLKTEDVAALVGIGKTQAAELEPHLEHAGLAYEGLFSTGWQRWWAHRVEDWTQHLFGRRATGLPASDRARLVSERLGLDLQPAPSPWNGSTHELIAFACASCHRGAEMRHSVAAFEGGTPRFISRRRICWDCVQTDRYHDVPGLMIDETDEALAKDVRSLVRDEAGKEL